MGLGVVTMAERRPNLPWVEYDGPYEPRSNFSQWRLDRPHGVTVYVTSTCTVFEGEDVDRQCVSVSVGWAGIRVRPSDAVMRKVRRDFNMVDAEEDNSHTKDNLTRFLWEVDK
jgi:hypothetical protein